MAIKKNLPVNEIVWEHRIEPDDRHYYVTSTKLRDKYNLWRRTEDGYELISTARTPALLMIDEEKKTRRRSSSL